MASKKDGDKLVQVTVSMSRHNIERAKLATVEGARSFSAKIDALVNRGLDLSVPAMVAHNRTRSTK